MGLLSTERMEVREEPLGIFTLNTNCDSINEQLMYALVGTAHTLIIVGPALRHTLCDFKLVSPRSRHSQLTKTWRGR